MNPWTVTHQTPRSMEFSRQEYWHGLPFPCPGDLPTPGVEPGSATLQAGPLPSKPSVFLPKTKQNQKTLDNCFECCKGEKDLAKFEIPNCNFSVYVVRRVSGECILYDLPRWKETAVCTQGCWCQERTLLSCVYPVFKGNFQGLFQLIHL